MVYICKQSVFVALQGGNYLTVSQYVHVCVCVCEPRESYYRRCLHASACLRSSTQWYLFFFVARNISVCAQIRGKKRVYLCDL